jgi:hypothetical protein
MTKDERRLTNFGRRWRSVSIGSDFFFIFALI